MEGVAEETGTAPANDLQTGKIRLPLLVDDCGLVFELVGGLHHDERRTGDQIVSLEKTVDRAFRDKITVGIGESCAATIKMRGARQSG